MLFDFIIVELSEIWWHHNRSTSPVPRCVLAQVHALGCSESRAVGEDRDAPSFSSEELEHLLPLSRRNRRELSGFGTNHKPNHAILGQMPDQSGQAHLADRTSVIGKRSHDRRKQPRQSQHQRMVTKQVWVTE